MYINFNGHNFCGWRQPRKFPHNKIFNDYGTPDEACIWELGTAWERETSCSDMQLSHLTVLASCDSSCSTAYYDYFLTPHESQSHGSVTMSDGKVGAAYCAVNPEDGVEIYYKVCIYHGGQTDLDWVAAPFIANGSSECCQCGMCGERVLGPGVTATPSLSPPNSNNFSVPACQVRSKTASSSFVCLAHRETEVVSSKEQALALFHFQLVLPHQLQPQNPIPLLASIILIVVCPAQFAVIMCLCCVICKWIRRSKSEHPGTTGSFINGSTDHRHGGGEGGQSAVGKWYICFPFIV